MEGKKEKKKQEKKNEHTHHTTEISTQTERDGLVVSSVAFGKSNIF